MKDFCASKSVFDVVGLGAMVFHVGLTHPQTRFCPLFLATLDPGPGNRSLSFCSQLTNSVLHRFILPLTLDDDKP